MKSPGGTLISPDVEGWRVLQGGVAKKYPTLGEAAAALPAEDRGAARAPLPGRAARAADAARRRIAKSSRACCSFNSRRRCRIRSRKFRATSRSSTRRRTNRRCSPWPRTAASSMNSASRCAISRGCREKITLFAMHVAAACPPDETVLAIYAEQGQFVVAICENGKLSWAQTVAGLEDDALLERAAAVDARRGDGRRADAVLEHPPGPGTGAAGAPAARSFPAARSSSSRSKRLPEPTRQSRPVRLAGRHAPARARRAAQAAPPARRGDLPAARGRRLCLSRVAEARGAEDRRAIRRGPARSSNSSHSRERRGMRSGRPSTRAFTPSKSSTRRTTICRRSDVRITEFIQTAGKWTIVGEAPSANLAIEYAEKLKSEKELEAWTIASAPPTILKGEQAKFSIEGQPMTADVLPRNECWRRSSASWVSSSSTSFRRRLFPEKPNAAARRISPATPRRSR